MKMRFNELLSVASNLAILGGIVLVAVELQQNQTLVRAELASEAFSAGIGINTQLIGNSPELVLAKACLHHEELTPEDILILKRITFLKITSAERGKVIADIANLGNDWRGDFQRAFTEIFSIQFSREYYEEIRNTLPEYMKSIADPVLASMPAVSCANTYSPAIL
ncbi:MAG: hypothetical protein P8I38_03245 [Arenicella sp.]|jgi:hypothetical protein|nr:hypothetical protein [Arenicella sp.]